MSRRRYLVPFTLAIAVVAAACGGSSKSSSATTAAGATTTAAAATTTAGSATTAAGSTTTGQPTTTAPIPTTTTIKAETLPGCDPSALASATSPVNITLWHGMTADNEKALQALADAYNASQTKVKVTLANQGGYEQTIDKYRTATKSNRPAIVQMPEYTVQLMIDSKTAVPVQNCITNDKYDTSAFIPRVLGYYTVGSVLWPMPFNVSNPVLYFNKKVFTKAGLDPANPPKTITDLQAAAQKIVASKAATYGLSLDTGFDSGGGWYIEQWFSQANKLYSDADNGRSGTPTKVLWDDPLATELLTTLQTMVKDKSAVNVGENKSGQDNLLKLADAKQPAAMAIFTSAGLGSVLSILKAGTIPGFAPEDLGVGPLPGPSSDGGVLVGGAALWLTAGKSPVETAAAWDFIKFASAAQQQATWAAKTGYVPIRSDALDQQVLKDVYAATPYFKIAYDQLLAGNNTPAGQGVILGPQRQVRQVLGAALQKILDGADVKSTLAAAETQANAIIASYYKGR